MNMLPLLMLALSQPAATPPVPLDATQQRDLSCVAVLAIIASEQERAVESALDYPLLSERGATYAALVGQRIMDDTGRTKEQVRDDILAAVADQQTMAQDAADPDALVRSEMATCLPLLDAAVPPKPKPDLTQCAGMLQLAYEEVHSREGLSKTAQDLKTLAAVLDSRARDQMRAEGLSGQESDILLTQSREAMLTDSKQKESLGQSSDLDFDHCFLLAAPEEKQPRNEH
ncbi:MAG: hypothetical protein ACI9TB_000650 [Parasphingorhabdus sp.]|jgi:hypothetical protein|uniref:hypothetical protein n=1 Tax=Parasphingorhabdus sp. TaxID=2709688 RepID=UPI002B27393C|nr:hypothetical protein [Parasphingorhabdus sp.]|tara:strand:+ start:5525 stop:6214 length:690 start_codon:yes stop_codon:yes gene_type:complete